MKIRWGRLVVGTLAAEALLVLLLVAVVAIFGPAEPDAARQFAERMGRWVGPVGGALIALLGGFWAARPLAAGHLLHGALLGLFLALLDALLLAASQAPFEWVFLASNLGKIAAGGIGGELADRHGRLEHPLEDG